MKLRNKVAVITGAGTGIGREIALLFAKEGAKVVINDLKLAGAKKVAQEIGKKAFPIAADVADSAAVGKMFKRIEKEYGRIDVLVNNAGIAQTADLEIDKFNRIGEARAAETLSGEGIKTHWTITQDLSDAAWKRMIDVHMGGTFFCTRAAIPMLAKSKGAIVNMASVAGLSGLEAIPHYSAAKAGILGFTRALALELGSQQIRVNAICPGFIETPMTDPISPVLRQMLISQTPLLRWGTPDEIAKAALFLATDDASYVTGQWLSPNGGLTMQ